MFYITKAGEDYPDPYDIGWLHLKDKKTGLSSEDAQSSKNYMVYVELLNFFGMAYTAYINSTKESYTFDDGHKSIFDGDRKIASLSFPGIKIEMDLKEVLQELQETLKQSCIDLAKHPDSNNSIILDLKDSFEISKNL
ncbi:hypothetical protein HRQ87_10665 [Sulfitobacter sp. 1151]|uniref:Uncharacterized protein n=1 Tax=Parasulfitobacter algicola TaxID=2614809 RepID=A0ABX2ISH8_9RHOB|nr:hypothetical protein [Sulfitobacter algicola]